MKQTKRAVDTLPETPFFLWDADDFTLNYEAFCAALEAESLRYRMSYSYKTNSLPSLLRRARDLGLLAEVVSEDEYELAEAIGYAAPEIIYNGPIKNESSFFRALEAGALVQLDAWRELRWAAAAAAARPQKEYRVGLRVHFDLEKGFPGASTAGERGPRFGFYAEGEELREALHTLRLCPNLRIVSLHVHHSNHCRDVSFYAHLVRETAELIRRFALQPEYLDIGGSFFAGGALRDRYALYAKALREALDEAEETRALTLILEPGAALVASSFRLYSRVLELKSAAGARYALTDASRCLIDPFMRKAEYAYEILPRERRAFPLSSGEERAARDAQIASDEGADETEEVAGIGDAVSSRGGVSFGTAEATAGSSCAALSFSASAEEMQALARYEKVRSSSSFRQENRAILARRECEDELYIAGYSCMENDLLMKREGEAALRAGDLLIYDCVGSYTMSFNPLFIRYLPEVYEKMKDEIRLCRRKFKVGDYLATEVCGAEAARDGRSGNSEAMREIETEASKCGTEKTGGRRA